MSAFLRAVAHVVGVRADPQVRRVHASRVIAGMESLLPLRYLAHVKLVGHAMRSYRLPEQIESPVAIRAFSGKPIPTFSRLAAVELGLETLLKRSDHRVSPGRMIV